MRDDERFVAQMAAAFRLTLTNEATGGPDDVPVYAATDEGVHRERVQRAILSVAGAALGDPRSLPARDEVSPLG